VLKSAKGAYTFAVSGAENGTFYLVRLPDSASHPRCSLCSQRPLGARCWQCLAVQHGPCLAGARQARLRPTSRCLRRCWMPARRTRPASAASRRTASRRMWPRSRTRSCRSRMWPAGGRPTPARCQEPHPHAKQPHLHAQDMPCADALCSMPGLRPGLCDRRNALARKVPGSKSWTERRRGP